MIGKTSPASRLYLVLENYMKQFLYCLTLYICNYWISQVPVHWIRMAYYRHIMRFKIGRGTTILMGARFLGYRRLAIGNGCVINENCVFGNRGGIRIGNRVSISPQVYLQSGDHDINSRDFKTRYEEVIIEDFCFVGIRATVLRGVTLGKGSVVGAGSLVTKSVGPYEIWGGVPAKKLGDRSKDIDYQLDWKPLFH